MIVNKPTMKKKKKISRYTVLSIIMCIIFSIISFRLLYLQIFSYEQYKERADVTSTRFVAEKAPRGKIYDQKGIVLATNKQTYTITYTKTDDADKQLYSTMKELFKILDENGEKVQDTLPLKIDSNNNLYYQYKTDKKETQDNEELRFKKDRGINDILRKTMFKDVEELSDAQNTQLDKALLTITPEEAFYDLVKSYNLIELIDSEYNSKEKTKIYTPMSGKELTDLILEKGYSLNDIRKYMLIKDAIKMQSFKGYRSVTIAGNIKRETSLIVRQKLSDMPGIDVSLTPIREYPFNNLASSVLGYVSSISDTQKERYELKGYDISSDLIGANGIESAFEEQLAGVKGGTTIKVNSQGRMTQELFKLESYPGKDVHLTIDSGIQYAAEQAFADGIKNIVNTPDGMTGYRYLNATRGALIAVEVKTGRILSLVSYPNFNPNLFAVQGQLTDEQTTQYFNPNLNNFGQEFINRMSLNKTVNDLFPISSDGHSRSDPNELYPRPMYNYATMAKIPPGSTFKPLTALAGLESGVNTPDTVIVDKGEYREHPEIFGKDFAPKGLEAATGPTTLTRAIAESINYYFYETGYKLYMNAGGPTNNTEALDSIAKYAWQFGLGRDPKGNEEASTGIEIGENFGQVYNFQSWKENIIAFSKYNLVEALEEKGEYNSKSFIKFDIRVSDNDKEIVKNAKQSIKDKVADSLSKVGVKDAKMATHDEFAKDIRKDVKIIMDNSDVYKQRVADEEASGRKVNLDAQASAVAEAIAQFTINDQAGQIKSPAQIVYASIGQGMNNFTPLQLVSYISTLANGGTRYKLHLVDEITDNEGKVVQEFKPEVLNTVSISKSTQEAIKKGMMAVNNGEDGTAKAAFAGFPISTAGKTGTADASEKQREIGRAPYATYVSYAPAENPEIAVVAVVFDGGHGSSIASSVRAVYEAYFKDRLLQTDPNYASKSPTFQKYVVECPIGKK